MMNSTGLLIVSHSLHAAQGIADIAVQVSNGQVPIMGVGGNDAGGLGTSPDAISEALQQLLAKCEQVLVIPDLGSSAISVRSAMECIDECGRVRLISAPILEGAFMASVEASIGSSTDQVAAVAEGAREFDKFI